MDKSNLRQHSGIGFTTHGHPHHQRSHSNIADEASPTQSRLNLHFTQIFSPSTMQTQHGATPVKEVMPSIKTWTNIAITTGLHFEDNLLVKTFNDPIIPRNRDNMKVIQQLAKRVHYGSIQHLKELFKKKNVDLKRPADHHPEQRLRKFLTGLEGSQAQFAQKDIKKPPMFSSYVPPPTGQVQITTTTTSNNFTNGFAKSKSPTNALINLSPSFDKKPAWGANDHSPKANSDLVQLRSDGTIESILNPKALIAGHSSYKMKFQRKIIDDIGATYDFGEKQSSTPHYMLSNARIKQSLAGQDILRPTKSSAQLHHPASNEVPTRFRNAASPYQKHLNQLYDKKVYAPESNPHLSGDSPSAQQQPKQTIFQFQRGSQDLPPPNTHNMQYMVNESDLIMEEGASTI